MIEGSSKEVAAKIVELLKSKGLARVVDVL
jgi:hypothetical protein